MQEVVIVAATRTAGPGQNPARQAAIAAGQGVALAIEH